MAALHHCVECRAEDVQNRSLLLGWPSSPSRHDISDERQEFASDLSAHLYPPWGTKNLSESPGQSTSEPVARNVIDRSITCLDVVGGR